MSEESSLDVDWSPLESGGGDTAKLPALFKGLREHGNDPVQYKATFEELVANLTLKNTRAAAAPLGVPYLYALVRNSSEQSYYRSLPLQVVGSIALMLPDNYVPQGYDNAAAAADTADPGPHQAFAAVEATVPQLYPFLADKDVAVRSMAAYLLAFFPSARAASTEPLLAMVEREANPEPRCTAIVAVAMLHRGLAAADERAAAVAQLEAACAKTPSWGRDTTDNDVSLYALALARCIVGVNELADVELVLRVATHPFYLSYVPGLPAKRGESELPFADPSLAALSTRVLAHLPGGPQPAHTVFALANALSVTLMDEMPNMVQALLRAACGTAAPDSDTDAVPTPWPAYADLDDRMGAAVRAIAKQHRSVFPFFFEVLKSWKLPTTLKGINAYMAGTPAADAAAAISQKSARGGCLSCLYGN